LIGWTSNFFAANLQCRVRSLSFTPLFPGRPKPSFGGNLPAWGNWALIPWLIRFGKGRRPGTGKRSIVSACPTFGLCSFGFLIGLFANPVLLSRFWASFGRDPVLTCKIGTKPFLVWVLLWFELTPSKRRAFPWFTEFGPPCRPRPPLPLAN